MICFGTILGAKLELSSIKNPPVEGRPGAGRCPTCPAWAGWGPWGTAPGSRSPWAGRRGPCWCWGPCTSAAASGGGGWGRSGRCSGWWRSGWSAAGQSSDAAPFYRKKNRLGKICYLHNNAAILLEGIFKILRSMDCKTLFWNVMPFINFRLRNNNTYFIYDK